MQTIIAAFNDASTAQQAVDSLIAHGFSRGSVHLQSAYAGDTSAATSGSITGTTGSSPEHQGFLAGVEHFFSNLFSSDDDHASTTTTNRYVDTVRQGRSVVAVDAASDAELDKATTLLYDLGAVDIDEQDGQTAAYAGTSTTDSLGRTSGAATTATGAEGVMQVVQEELVVGKRVVQKGGVRVVKRITETPVSELVRLREEHAVVERRPVDRPATEADFTGFKEGTIEVREQAEEAVVGKTARVVEEVVVGKQASEREETVSDTVRRTDVDVETIPTTETTTTSATGTYGTAGTTGTKRGDI